MGRCLSCLSLSRLSVIAFILSYSTKRSAIICFFHETCGGGGVMYLVYGSSSSFYMDCMVFLVMSVKISTVWSSLTPCSHICAYIADLVIFGHSFCGSPTFRMSTRRLPDLLFVSRIEYPFISCCFVARRACGGRRGLLPCMRALACQ